MSSSSPCPLSGSSSSDSASRYEMARMSLEGKLIGKKIVIITLGVDNLGDYLCARKIGGYFLEELKIAPENIAFATDTTPQIKELLELSKISVIGTSDESLIAFNPDLQIIAPVTEYHFVSDKVMGQEIPSLIISEYGFSASLEFKAHPNTRAYAMGFAEGALGILIDRELQVWSLEEELPREKKLEELSALPKGHREAILGGEWSSSNLRTFAGAYKFYLGYAHKFGNILSFIFSLLEMNHDLKDPSNLCFFLLGNPFEIYEEEIIAALKTREIGHLEIIDATSPSSPLIDEMLGEGITLRIVFGKVDPDQVKNLIKASEYEMLTTGDQSFGEALSAGRMPVAYELSGHKEKSWELFLMVLPREISIQMRHLHQSHRMNELDSTALKSVFIYRRIMPGMDQLFKKAIRSLTQEYDFRVHMNEALKHLIEEVPFAKRRSIIPQTDLPLDRDFRSDDIPFDIQLRISLDAVCKLAIDRQGNSDLEVFRDSIFDAQPIHIEREINFLITRKKRCHPSLSKITSYSARMRGPASHQK
ncbi:MAG: hypothetical protein ACHQUC_04710 [Chlamydiales bacterium]